MTPAFLAASIASASACGSLSVAVLITLLCVGPAASADPPVDARFLARYTDYGDPATCDGEPRPIRIDVPLSGAPQTFGFFEVDGATPPPRAGRDGPIQIEVRGPALPISPDAPLSLDVVVVDTSDHPVRLIRPLDGTLEHMTEPFYDLYARDVATGAVFRYASVGGRCGNVNAIADGDYALLMPGEAFVEAAWGWGSYLGSARLERPGAYDVWVVYRRCADGRRRGVPLGEDVVRRDALVGLHASNAVRIVVR